MRTFENDVSDIDDIDFAILELLKRDSRITYKEVAENLSISESTVRNRIIKLTDKKIIEKFTIRLNLEKIDTYFGWILILNVNPSEIGRIIRDISECDNIVSIYEVSGEANLIIMGYDKRMENLKKFLNDKIYPSEGIIESKLEILIDKTK
ncbi:MAG: Lrp/AsnC family transcriptional regulator [Candidatus Helarchaeota archaeon]